MGQFCAKADCITSSIEDTPCEPTIRKRDKKIKGEQSVHLFSRTEDLKKDKMRSGKRRMSTNSLNDQILMKEKITKPNSQGGFFDQDTFDDHEQTRTVKLIQIGMRVKQLIKEIGMNEKEFQRDLSSFKFFYQFVRRGTSDVSQFKSSHPSDTVSMNPDPIFEELLFKSEERDLQQCCGSIDSKYSGQD